MSASLRRLALSLAALLLVSAPRSVQSQDFGDTRSQRPYSWIPSDEGQPLPRDAVRGGRESGNPLYVCRGRYAEGVHPGKVVGSTCNIGYGGKEVVLPRYEVLVGARDGWWGPARDRFDGAFEAGNEGGRALFLCRGEYRGGTHPGKVVSGKCNFGYGGNEISLGQFEVFYLYASRREPERERPRDWESDRSEPRYPDTQPSQSSQSSAPFTICSDQPIPRGLVVLKGGRDMNCSGWTATGFNTFTLKRPGDAEEICSSSPMPYGYVVVSEGLNWDCPGWTATGKNTKKIRRY